MFNKLGLICAYLIQNSLALLLERIVGEQVVRKGDEEFAQVFWEVLDEFVLVLFDFFLDLGEGEPPAGNELKIEAAGFVGVSEVNEVGGKFVLFKGGDEVADVDDFILRINFYVHSSKIN